MLTLFVSVEARPRKLTNGGSDQEVAGYFQTFGVTAIDERELLRLIEQYLAADLESELVAVSEKWLPDLDGNDRDIASQIGQMNSIGIWWSSGRAWFGPDEPES
jgi:hypothetical protein